MHELKMIQDIFPLIEKVAADHHLKKINQVALNIGKLRQVQKDFLHFAFENISKNTICSKAKLVVNIIPVKIICKNCQKEFEVEDNVYICSNCNGTNIEVLTGKELVLESVDGEQG